MEEIEPTLFAVVGGMPFFERLIDAFYDGVEQDDVLAPLYPEAPD
jgi:hemoglobin